MGSPISGYIVEIVPLKLEATAFETHKPTRWVRYVDDTFAIIKNGRQPDFKNHLNSVFTDIQFTRRTHRRRCVEPLCKLVKLLEPVASRYNGLT